MLSALGQAKLFASALMSADVFINNSYSLFHTPRDILGFNLSILWIINSLLFIIVRGKPKCDVKVLIDELNFSWKNFFWSKMTVSHTHSYYSFSIKRESMHLQHSIHDQYYAHCQSEAST